MNPTFNAAIDYFGLETASNGALKVTSSKENRSKSSASGANTYGDAARVDSWGETAAPSADYAVVGNLTSATMPDLGTVSTIEDIAAPVVLGGVTFNTSKGAPPTMSASGQMVQTGAKQLRKYKLPGFSITPRHRAQDMMGLCAIMKGDAAADDSEDYGLESVSASFPINITIAQPKGETKNYDLSGGMATCSYTMNWYASGKPTVSLTEAATALGATMSAPVDKACPEGGYVQYTWTVSFPLIGEEVAA
jgi:hypothetical protein